MLVIADVPDGTPRDHDGSLRLYYRDFFGNARYVRATCEPTAWLRLALGVLLLTLAVVAIGSALVLVSMGVPWLIGQMV